MGKGTRRVRLTKVTSFRCYKGYTCTRQYTTSSLLLPTCYTASCSRRSFVDFIILLLLRHAMLFISVFLVAQTMCECVCKIICVNAHTIILTNHHYKLYYDIYFFLIAINDSKDAQKKITLCFQTYFNSYVKSTIPQSIYSSYFNLKNVFFSKN